VKITHFSWN